MGTGMGPRAGEGTETVMGIEAERDQERGWRRENERKTRTGTGVGVRREQERRRK